MLKLIACLALFVFAELGLCRAANIRVSNLPHALDARAPVKPVSPGNLLARDETTTVVVPVSCTQTTYVTYFLPSTQLPGEKGQTSAAATTPAANPSPSSPSSPSAANPTTSPTAPASFATETTTPATSPFSPAFSSTPTSSGSPNSVAFIPGGSIIPNGGPKSSFTPSPTPSTLTPVPNAAAGTGYSSIAVGLWILAFNFLIGA